MKKRKFEFASELVKQMQQKTYSQISISELCEGLQCSRQGFYYYFKNLDDCFTYYLKESFKNQIKDDRILLDLFSYIDYNKKLINFCASDKTSNELFWNSLSEFLKKTLDLYFYKKYIDYLALYPRQKNAITRFYSSGLVSLASDYYHQEDSKEKEKYILYCQAILGTNDDFRAVIKRIANY